MSQQAQGPSEIVEIARLGHAGDGVAADGLFVAGTVPGDVVRVTREGGRGHVVELIQKGPTRTAPPCVHFGTCGGCALQHVAPEAYLTWKRDLVVTALKQRGFADVQVDEIRAVAPGTRRRANFKAQLEGRDVALGFYEAGSRVLVDLSECPILVPELARLMPGLRRHLSNVLRPNETAELLATATDSGIDLALNLKRKREVDLLTALSGIASALGLARLSWNGEDVAIAETPSLRVGRFTVALPPGAFLQPTKEGERMLQQLVLNAAAHARNAADLFSGCGTLALALAERHSVHAADSVAAQIEALLAAARKGNARVTGESRDLFRRPLLAAELVRFDAVVLDPPRPGASAQAKALAESSVPKVLYVSCNAASFARDARVLADGGYRLERVTPIDQFLWSPHVELFAEFSR
jgi:23S rRNA (uracil1939-C5)-methyltransferase